MEPDGMRSHRLLGLWVALLMSASPAVAAELPQTTGGPPIDEPCQQLLVAALAATAGPPLASPEPAWDPKATPAEPRSAAPPGAHPALPAPKAGSQEKEPPLRVTLVCGKWTRTNRAALYRSEPVQVKVDGLRDWLAKHGKDVSGFVLYLDGRALPELPVRLASFDNGVLEFDLERNKDSNRVWKVLFAAPDSFSREFRVSVGVGQSPPDGAGYPLELEVFSELWTWIFMGILAVALLALWWAGRNTNLLRDTTRPAAAGGRRPYSLGRCQMAFWFFLVVASYVLIWLITYDYHAMTSSALWLIGISSATALGSIAVDVVNTPRGAGAGPPAPPAPAAPAPSPPGAPATAAGAILRSWPFLRDLLGTDDGDGLHRLQMIVWTLVLGVIFVVTVWKELAMPEFSGEVLTLMGISGGAYVGFKLPERPR